MALHLAYSCTPFRGAALPRQGVPATRGLRASGVTPRLPRSRRPTRAVAGNDEQTELTGEWPVNWSIASYEDVGEYFKANLFKNAPMTILGDVMTTKVTVTTPDTPLKDAEKLFVNISGIPVVNNEKKLIGVVSKKDLGKGGSTVKDVMSTPPVAALPSSKVADAAALMLKHKVHRIPIVNDSKEIIGIVTRTDIFQALEASAAA
eukprot:jgi/Botrbrau1/14994/Bobra.0018s0094.1